MEQAQEPAQVFAERPMGYKRSSARTETWHAGLAQLVERLICNQ